LPPSSSGRASATAHPRGLCGSTAPSASPTIPRSRRQPPVAATGDATVDYYAFTVTTAGSTATFDIDGAWPSFDAWLALFDTGGTLLAENDDALTDPGSAEAFPSFTRDSFITYTFAVAGTYLVAVGRFASLQPVPAGASYRLHLSLDDATAVLPVSGNALHGGPGNDTLSGGAGADLFDGGDGADTADYSGSPGAVAIDLAAGTVSGGHAAGDTLTGIEDLRGSPRADRLTGNDGANVLDGGKGGDTLLGLGGDDLLIGGANDDVLLGGDGDDTLAGGTGNDTLDGGAGTDTADYSGFGGAISVKLSTGGSQFTGASGSDVIVLGSIENLSGGDSADRFTGSTRANLLEGYGGNDAFTGLGGSDTLDGGEGNDRLQGGNGDDLLEGGLGRDTLRGGGGADVFRFTDIAETAVGSGRDRLRDFTQGEDTIDISAIDAVAGGADDAFTFIGTVPFSATAGELRQVDTPLRILVEGDVDGDGAADFQIELTTTGLVVTADDFAL
jgi:Ca2+-binding RTX toxin-like protein